MSFGIRGEGSGFCVGVIVWWVFRVVGEGCGRESVMRVFEYLNLVIVYFVFSR